MKSQKAKGLFDGATPKQRLGWVVVGLIVKATGVLSLLDGRTKYRNFLGLGGICAIYRCCRPSVDCRRRRRLNEEQIDLS